MISFIKSWCLSVCLCALICAVCESFVGHGKLKNGMKFITAAFAMVCFLTPLFHKFPTETIGQQQVSYTLDEDKIVETYIESVRTTFEKYLRSNFDENASVGKIYTLKGADGNIYITEVAVDSEVDDKTLEELIRKEFGKNACLLRK